MKKLIALSTLLIAAGCTPHNGRLALSPLTPKGIIAYRTTQIAKIRADYKAGYLTLGTARDLVVKTTGDCRNAYNQR